MPDTTLDLLGANRPLLAAIGAAAHKNGVGKAIAVDITGEAMTYRQLFIRAHILGAKLAPDLAKERYVALLLPNANAAIATFVAMHLQNKIPCMLNYSSGEANILHACKIAGVRTVLTSRVFIERGKFHAIATALEKNYCVIYLEDLRHRITSVDKIKGLLKAMFTWPKSAAAPNDPAVILYTSGSEGVPKGVALSHNNILSNIAQIRARVPLSQSDIVFNALPLFHSFGLAIGMVMPLVGGLKTVLYPSPLQYRQIPGEIKKSGATILLGTDTFLRGWAGYGKPSDFASVRLAVAGAEKLKNTTREQWRNSFHIDILEGYGVTEASPVVAVNIPGDDCPGSVGPLVPGIDYKLETVAGLKNGGRLFIKGPNIMIGYLNPEKPGEIQPQGEWYDTGDIVSFNEKNCITIQGRAKRFAKLAGEMVSLLAVEELAATLLPNSAHAALAIPDERKGEQIVLYTEAKDLTREQLLEHARSRGVPELFLPRQIIPVETLPRLGNGKIDYQTLAKKNAS